MTISYPAWKANLKFIFRPIVSGNHLLNMETLFLDDVRELSRLAQICKMNLVVVNSIRST